MTAIMELMPAQIASDDIPAAIAKLEDPFDEKSHY